MSSFYNNGNNLRSDDTESSITRAFMQGAGFLEEKMQKRPVVGICNSWSELNPCNHNLRDVAERVKQGVIAAGGVPVEFPTISVHEQVNNPSSLFLRNLMSMDVEEMIKHSPIDGVVLLNGCDKTVPAQIMGAVSADKPMISLSAGPRNTSVCGGEAMTIHNLWGKKAEREKGEVADEEWREFTKNLIPSAGTCNVMGTASTMAAMVEALGLSLPATAFLPATSAARLRAAESTGETAIHMIEERRTPATYITEKSLENAYRTVCALGGSTNALIHLEAIAGRMGLCIGVERFREWNETTPQLAAVIPSGPYLLEELDEAGGIPGLFSRMPSLLHLECPVITGETWAETMQKTKGKESPALRSLDHPVQEGGGLAVLQGSLAPGGAVFKRSAVPREWWQHRGPALVFDGLDDMKARINDPDLDVEPESVLVLRGMGPVGGPGMPESAKIPIPKKIWDKGIKNMLRLSDGRMSGTADGAVVLHVTPEAAAGGPLSLVRDGDMIELDAVNCRIDLDIGQKELEQRIDANAAEKQPPLRGYEWLYHHHVTQADKGADFDFLRK
ncbi:dihydroxy-acid dehydratase [Salibacterium aidingense]|uniref:dihydroxy-acid dehydratase n=1 Tax=Salibacterium aidingense TaxID=384933 RepID=UPI003BBEC3DE